MLATGDARFKEKMDLDIQVSKLRVLKQSYLSEHYDLEDRVLKYYPQTIKEYEERIAGYENDAALAEQHKPQGERWIITGGAVYFNSISSIKHNCIRDFINGNKRKEFIFIWHECHLFINKLWSNRFDSGSTFCNNSLDMGSSFSCVGTFICNADKKIA